MKVNLRRYVIDLLPMAVFFNAFVLIFIIEYLRIKFGFEVYTFGIGSMAFCVLISVVFGSIYLSRKLLHVNCFKSIGLLIIPAIGVFYLGLFLIPMIA